MAESNPDILIPLLEEFSENLERWDYYASEALEESERMLITAKDCNEKSTREVSFSQSKIEESRTQIITEGNSLSRIRDRVYKEDGTTKATNESARTMLESSRSNLNYWEDELNKGTHWLKQAEKRLSKAIDGLDAASNSLQDAEIELAAAEEALAACESDEDRKTPCVAESIRVTTAKMALSIAKQRFKSAKKELERSEIEVNDANDCINRCTEALEISNRHLTCAVSAINASNQALQEIEESVVNINNAQGHLKDASKTNDLQQELQQENDLILNNQTSWLYEAEVLHRENREENTSAQDLLNETLRELRYRTEQLIRFASPARTNVPSGSGGTILSALKNPAIITGAILGAGLLLGASPMAFAAGTLMTLLTIGVADNKKSINSSAGSGLFQKTGPNIDSVPLLDTQENNDEIHHVEKEETGKTLEDKVINELPWRTEEEEKLIMEYQRLNHPVSEYKMMPSSPIRESRQSSYYLGKPFESFKEINYHMERPVYYRGNSFDRIKDAATDILMKGSPLEVYYDPIGKAIDKAENKEFHGHWGLSPDEKSAMRKEVEYEKIRRMENPNYAIPVSRYEEFSYNNLKPLY